MAKRKTNVDYKRIGEQAIRDYQKYKNAKTVSTKARYRNKIESLEVQLRKTANSRLRQLRSKGLTLDTTAQIELQISYQQRARRYLSKPKDFETAYKHLMAEANFLSKEMSTVSGARTALSRIREDFEKSGYYHFKSDEEFQSFYLWRNQNAVHDFFNIFPPSPPEMQDEVSAMAYDLFQKGGKEKKMMEQYFKAWESFRKSEGDVGISLGELRDKIFKLYESGEKRTR